MSKGYQFKPDASDMKKMLSAKKGNIAAVARELDITRETIYEYLKRTPDVQSHLDNIRNYNEFDDLDSSEFVIRYCQSLYKENPRIALDSAKYVLDKKGHKRNWGDGGQMVDQEKLKNQLHDLSSWTKDAHQQILEEFE